MTPENFRAAMRSTGLDFPGPIADDGRLHRFKSTGDHDRNSWYVLHAGPPAAGAFGCWKRGVKETWCERGGNLSQAEWNEVRRRWQDAELERERAEKVRRAKSQDAAAWILDRARPLTDHPYIAAKCVRVFGDVREYRGALVLPLRDADGQLHSLQLVGPEGSKRFLSGGRVSGCFFALAEKPDGPLVIVEGYATGASVAEATGHAVVCAMNAGNMPAVAAALRARCPGRDIILAADNDARTQGNPGLTKATEAAKAIGARLAVPQFKSAETNPTDFNDLARLEGPGTVKQQIESAASQRESDDEILKRLAGLSPLDYEREREGAALTLGCRASILDKLVDGKRSKSDTGDGELQGQAMRLADVEPWTEPVIGADVLSELADAFSRYVALPDGAADALALWTAHAHCFQSFVCSPRLNIWSPDKGCGKTTLRDVIAALVPRPLPTENLSVAVLFRVIAADRPTLLADECDAWLRDNEELRGMLNAGHRLGGQALRCEGESNEVRKFNVYSPAVLCGIGSLPGTLHDRSIAIRLDRAKSGELRERFDLRHTERETELCRKLARYCADNRERLAVQDPVLPSAAVNRLGDNWRPLFAIAAIAGADWPSRAAGAFAKLTTRTDTDAQGIGTMLLADIAQVFSEGGAERVFSKALVEALCAMTDRPWPEAHRGKPVTETWLARRLHNFGINPKTLRIGDARAKGYEAADFADSFARYLVDQEVFKRDTVTSEAGVDETGFSKRDNFKACHASKTPGTPANTELSRCHGSNTPPPPKQEVLLV